MTKKVVLGVVLALIFTIPMNSVEKEILNNEIQPMVVTQFLEKAKKNNNWKTAFVTGRNEQIVFMNISHMTNPDNEIGMEDHPFDQVILIVEGRGKAILEGQASNVNEGDMIFIPQGTRHNVINLDQAKGLKLISFYSETDIPRDTVYNKKADAPKD